MLSLLQQSHIYNDIIDIIRNTLNHINSMQNDKNFQQQLQSSSNRDQIDLYKKLQQLIVSQKNHIDIDKFPQKFLQFLKTRNINIMETLQPIPRYIRCKPSVSIKTIDISKSLKIQKIVQIDQYFWALQPSCKIQQSQLYQQGLLYGMDICSSIPVKVLSAQIGDRVLELCSAPGNKALYLYDMVPKVSIVGVEINENRANVMRSQLKKYGASHSIQVVVADGVNYTTKQLFDKVLVDAQCTHEGSLKHLNKFMIKNKKNQESRKEKKYSIKINKNQSKQQLKQYTINNNNPYTSNIYKNNQWTVEDFEQRFLDSKKLANLKQLQYGLLSNGFKLLKDHGILVYSMCSMDEGQNQDVVKKLLQQEKQADLCDASEGLKTNLKIKRGMIAETIRMTPIHSLCGGMFVCKIRKKETKILKGS